LSLSLQEKGFEPKRDVFPPHRSPGKTRTAKERPPLRGKRGGSTPLYHPLRSDLTRDGPERKKKKRMAGNTGRLQPSISKEGKKEHRA